MLQGKEIILRHVKASDLESLIGLMNNVEMKGEFARTLLKSPASFNRDFADNGFSTEKSELFVIVDRADQIIGTIGHFTTVHYSSARELGFSVFPSQRRNKGIATEAVQILTNYLFDNLPINRIQICMAVDHKSCESVAIKAGYKKEGIARGSIFVKGQYLDTSVYSILRSENAKNQ